MENINFNAAISITTFSRDSFTKKSGFPKKHWFCLIPSSPWAKQASEAMLINNLSVSSMPQVEKAFDDFNNPHWRYVCYGRGKVTSASFGHTLSWKISFPQLRIISRNFDGWFVSIRCFLRTHFFTRWCPLGLCNLWRNTIYYVMWKWTEYSFFVWRRPSI